MSYYNKLKADKLNREKYEKDEESLKQAIFDINSIYSLHDGLFIKELTEFLTKWKNKE